MNNLEQFAQNGLTSSLTIMGSTFTWKSGTYTGVIGDIVRDQFLDADAMGRRLNEERTLAVGLDQFTGSAPAIGDTITISGANYRYVEIESQDAVLLTMRIRRLP